MLPCICSVIDHRWRQNVVKTKKWHKSHRWVCQWCFYHILTSSVIFYWTDPRQKMESFCYIQWSEKNKNKTDTHTRLVPLDSSKILSPTHYFLSPLLLFFLILLVNSFFKKFFNVFTCSKQKCRKHFAKQRDSRSEYDTRWQLLWSFLACSIGILKLLRTLFVSVFPFSFFINSSCSTFFEAFTCLIWKNLTNFFETACHVEQYKENKFSMTSSMYMYL